MEKELIKCAHNLTNARAAYTTADKQMLTVVKDATTLSFRREPVLITGATGTGKELIARIVHGANKGSLVPVNTTAVTDSLFESELFGHMKGSFTGAFKDREGLVHHTGEGTLFLDEIGDMPVELQAKILRLIQFGTYRIVGDNKTQKSKCRIIAATCKPLQELIRNKLFREDLYYRLSTFRLHLTPLKDRRHDAELYVTSHPKWASMDRSARDSFLTYVHTEPLDGNYRELEQVMLRYEVLEELPAQKHMIEKKS